MRTGLVGFPIAHSLSPAIHNAAYEALGLDWRYEAHPCEDAAAFEGLIRRLAADPAVIGVNVTTPYKTAAFNLADEAADTAAVVCGANVLTFAPPGALAHGRPCMMASFTDGAGLVASIQRDARIPVKGAAVALCGTGPVAAAVLAELLAVGAASVRLLTRDDERAIALLHRLRGARMDVSAVRHCRYGDSAAVAQAVSESAVIIDATPLGMHQGDPAVIPVELLNSRHHVFDVVYGHGETALLAGARSNGAAAYDGKGMLVEQAALAIEQWAKACGMDIAAPRDVMYAAFDAAAAGALTAGATVQSNRTEVEQCSI
jgi:shikimate dehydrogenase